VIGPSGDQFSIEGGGYRAVVTECGAGLRLLEYDGRALLDGFAEDEMASAGKGQLLLPWPNRVAQAAYTFQGRHLQLPITEPALGNASHGLVRWVAWSLEEQGPHTVSLMYRLMAQSGYPWTVDLHVLYDVSADGLTVTVTATNMSDSPAPYAQGAHPYLTLGDGGIGGWSLSLPARTLLLVDEALIPVGRADVSGEFAFRSPRPIGNTELDTAYTDLERDATGRAEVSLSDGDRSLALWMDDKHRWVQVFTGGRASVAVEPMTAPPNAFNSGEDLVVLTPAGTPGDEHSSSWGIRAN
jgi:aldose 1-epimerase